MARKKQVRDTDFSTRLIDWYRRHRRDLPWRKTRDPYRIWVSEVMLQQTTVPAVIPYYRKWMELFPDVQSLGRASLQSVLKAWEGLGYYQRAKNLHRAAKIIVKDHGGTIPGDYESLRKLPGFGPYTTAAVASLAFDSPIPVIDANVRRVLMRLKDLRRKANLKHDKGLLRFLSPLLPKNRMGIFNQAMMELGALVCRPKYPLCLICPVIDYCLASQQGTQEVIPLPTKRVIKKIKAVIAVIEKDGKYLIQKRPSEGLLADLWEFPGGKKRPGESPAEALRREVREELGVELSETELLTTVRHAYTMFQVKLYVYACRLSQEPPLKKNRQRWISLKGLRRYPFPSGSAKIVKHLEERTSDPKKN